MTWWRSLRRGPRAVVLVAALVFGFNVALAGLGAVTGGSGPGGPPSSSYATAPDGLAGLADLLRSSGHPVQRFRTRLDRADLDPSSTVVVADVARLPDSELDAVARFVDAGGRLVATGPDAAGVVGRVVGAAPTWSPEAVTTARALVPVAEVAGVTSVVSAGPGSWSDPGATLPVLAGGGPGRHTTSESGTGPSATLATVASPGGGGGRVVALADTSVWQNRLLARADNAAFALAAMGEPGRAVGFAEAPHGYGTGRGLSALPAPWKRALVVGAVAVLVWMWARGRRLGPPEELERPLPPPRRAYVDAVAATLVRTRQPAEAMMPLQAAARRRLERAGGLAAGAGAGELALVARRVGLSDEALAAVTEPTTTQSEVMAAAAALAHLEGASR